MASPLRLFKINRIKTNSVVKMPNWTQIYWTDTSLWAFAISAAVKNSDRKCENLTKQ